MITDRERERAANSWNSMMIEFLIDHMEGIKSRLEKFENLGSEAAEMIDSQITALECLITDYKIHS